MCLEERKLSASLRAQLAFFCSRPQVLLAEDPEVFTFDSVLTRAPDGRKRVGIGVFGSLEEAGALELVQASKEAEVAAAAATADKAIEKEAKKKETADARVAVEQARADKLAAFHACRAARVAMLPQCACGQTTAMCKSLKLKLCPTCNSVTTTGCGKKGACEAARAAAVSAVSPMDSA